MSRSNGIPLLHTKYKITEFGEKDENGNRKIVSKRKLVSGVSLHEEEAEILNSRKEGTRIVFVAEKSQPLIDRFKKTGSVAKGKEEPKATIKKAAKETIKKAEAEAEEKEQ